MHCVIIHQHFSTPKGATSVRTWHFAKSLIDAGHHVTVICGRSDIADTGCSGVVHNKKRTASQDGISIIECDVPYANNFGMKKRMHAFLSFAWYAIRELLKLQPDVVYVNSSPLTVAFPGLFAKYVMRVPMVFEAQDLWPKAPVDLGILKNKTAIYIAEVLEKAVVRSADQLVALAPGSITHFVALGAKKEHIHFLPNFSTGRVQKNSRSIESDELKAVYVGAHGIINELEPAIQAAEITAKSNLPISLDFFGSGSEQEALRNLVATKKIAHIRFHDAVRKEMVPTLLADFDVGLLLMKDIEAMREAGSPNKFFDYLAVGLPIICNYEGWLADEIRTNNCGVVVDRSPQKLAEALLWLYHNPAKRKELGQNARRLYEQKYSSERICRGFVQCIGEAYGKKIF